MHVVVTTRDLGQAVSSAWQERLKFALDVPLEEWQPPPESRGPRAEWGWRTMDPASVAGRWGAGLPPERVHIVTAPRRGAARRELWDRFAEACSLQDVTVDLDIPPANESLGVKAAEVLRKVNEQDLGPITGAREQSRWLRDTLAHTVLAPLDDEPMGITDVQLAEAEERARAAVAAIGEAGWTVHGDLDDVTATRREGRMPGEVPAEELLDVAVRTITGLLLELREARTSGGWGWQGRRSRRPRWRCAVRSSSTSPAARAARCSTASPSGWTSPRRTSRRGGGCRSGRRAHRPGQRAAAAGRQAGHRAAGQGAARLPLGESVTRATRRTSRSSATG